MYIIPFSEQLAMARVYVGDLGSDGSKPELEKEFEQFGSLKSVWVARNPPGKRSGGDSRFSLKLDSLQNPG